MALSSTAGVTYDYDVDGARVVKSSGTLYWPGLGGQVLTEANFSGLVEEEYVYFNGQRIARLDNPLPIVAVHYYFSDHLGSASVITDQSGYIQEQYYYYPYGGQLVTSTGSDSNRYKFNGKERDSESGNDYFGARYYGSSIGRFVTPDWAAKPTAVPYAMFGNPQSLNLYSYVDNNPTTTRDPDGHCAEAISCGIEFGAGGSFFGPVGTGIGVAVGVGVGLYVEYKGLQALNNYIHSSDNSNANPASGTQPKDVYIDPNRYPASAGHVADAQAAGKPDVLTVDRTAASDRRAAATAGHATQPGTDRDEYPPAVTREGGAGASVQNIPSSDNRGSGASLGNQISDVPNGGQIRVIPQPKPQFVPCGAGAGQQCTPNTPAPHN